MMKSVCTSSLAQQFKISMYVCSHGSEVTNQVGYKTVDAYGSHGNEALKCKPLVHALSSVPLMASFVALLTI